MKRVVIALTVLVFVAASGRAASAAPIVGAQLFYTGGDITVTSLPATSGFVSELGLYNSSFTLLMPIMLDEPAGVVVTFNPGTLFGAAVGSELIFGINVFDTGDKYFIGPGSRNPDGIHHVAVDTLGAGSFIVGFEDLFGGGDLDYDDNIFSFEGGLQAVPEPATLSLLALGLIPALRRRSRR
jgi:hypothetical protein